MQKAHLRAGLQDLETQPLLFHGFDQATTMSANAIPWLTVDPTDLVTPRSSDPNGRARVVGKLSASRRRQGHSKTSRPLVAPTCISEAAVALHRNRMQTIALMCYVVLCYPVRARLHTSIV